MFVFGHHPWHESSGDPDIPPWAKALAERRHLSAGRIQAQSEDPKHEDVNGWSQGFSEELLTYTWRSERASELSIEIQVSRCTGGE